MADWALRAYRFSVAWPRVQPGGRARSTRPGSTSTTGSSTSCSSAASSPWLTLYHWDLPQALEDAGGWPARDTAERFAEYAATSCTRRSATGCARWTTLNEPWCSAFLGYATGGTRPGGPSPAAAVAARTTCCSATAWPSRRCARRADAAGRHHAEPVRGHARRRRRRRTPTPPAASTACRTARSSTRCCGAATPTDVRADLAASTDFGFVRDGDLETIAAPIDFLGVNYYSRHVVARLGALPGQSPTRASSSARGRPRHRDGLGGRRRRPDGAAAPGAPRLRPTSRSYVTENGAAFDDAVDADGAVRRRRRLAYLAVAHRRLPARDRGRCAAARLLRLVAAGQLRVGATATASASASSTSTTRPSERRSRTAAAGTPTFLARYRDGGRVAMTQRSTRAAADPGAGRGPRRRRPRARSRGSSTARPRCPRGARPAVQAAVDELGYVPNRAARSLVTRRTDTVALVVSESEDRLFGEPFFAGIVRGISAARHRLAAAAPAGDGPVHDRARAARALPDPASTSTACCCSRCTATTRCRGTLEERGVPTVLGGRPVGPAGRYSYVDVDNVGGARQAVAHLLGSGRRRIATITGPQDMGAGQDRLAGYAAGPRRSRAGGRPVAGRASATSARRAARARCARCWRAAPTSTPSSPPPT